MEKDSATKLNQKLTPFTYYSDTRKNSPLVYDERSGSWNVYRYNDVKQVLTNYVDFSSDFVKALAQSSPESQEGPFRRTLITSDPPVHRFLRGIISSVFSVSSIEALGPRIKDISNELIDKVIEEGSMDLVRDFSYPLPVTVIAELLGIPTKDRDLFKRWADELLKSIDDTVSAAQAGKSADNIRMQRLQKEMNDYFRNVIAEKRKAPGQDLITRLIKAETHSKRLSEGEILSFCALLLQAGHLTTVNLINNCIWSLLENPSQLEKLENGPLSSTSTSAIEETLRYRSPVQGLARICVRKTELGGTTISPGQRVITWIGSANHDEAIFSNPEKFDIMRSPNPHIAFGSGIHLCLGAPLARLEGHIALETLLSRLQNLEFGDSAEKLEPISESLFLYGVKSLPLRFKAASRQAGRDAMVP